MNGKVVIEKSKDKHASCNCCSASIENLELWDVRFTFSFYTSLVKLCDKHLLQ